MIKTRNILLYDWRSIIATAVILSVISGLFCFQLGKLTGGANKIELVTLRQNVTIQQIINDPVNAPYFVIRNIMQKAIRRPSIYIPRLANVLFALLAVAAVYRLLSLWYGKRLVVLGTLLFATSNWTLHMARIGLPDSLQSLGIVLILLSVWLYQSTKKNSAVACITTCLGVLLYIPAMIWLIAFAGIWKHTDIRRDLATVPKTFITLCGALFLLFITPLVLAMLRDPAVGLRISGLSNILDIQQIIVNLYNIPMQIFFRSPYNPLVTLGKLPFIDIFTAFMVVLGIYSAYMTRTLDRSKLTLGLFIIGIITSAVSYSPFLPFMIIPIYLLAISGVAFMLDNWYIVFPRNPIARTIGTTMISIAVLVSSYYSITNYFIAWPNNPDVKSNFSERI